MQQPTLCTASSAPPGYSLSIEILAETRDEDNNQVEPILVLTRRELVQDPGVYDAAPQRPAQGPVFELGQPARTAAQPQASRPLSTQLASLHRHLH